ncbi:MAG: hypothetical protein WAW11_02550 [Patescibacteria group bacterium]
MPTTTTIVIIFVLLALAEIAVITIFKLKVKRIRKIVYNETSKTNLLTAMLEQSQKSETFDVNIFNITPLEVIKEIRRTIVQHYFICFNKLKAVTLGDHLLQIRAVVISDRRDYLMSLLYQAAEEIKIEVWGNLLTQAIIAETVAQDPADLDKTAEVIGFVITIAEQQELGLELSQLFEGKIRRILLSDHFNEGWKNKIEIAMLRINNSLSQLE